MYKISNVSGQVLGLVNLNEKGLIEQRNLFDGDSIEVERLEGQLYNLCDPYKKLMKVEEVL